MNRSVSSFLTVLAAVLLSSPANADTIYLKSGSKFEGKVEEKGDQVVLHLENGSKMSFPKDMVVHIARGPAPWEVYAQKVKKLQADDADAHLEMAKWCRGKKLRRRAARHLEATIKLRPDDAEAHKLLGHEKFEGKWMTREETLKAKGYVEVKGKWMSPEEYAAHQAQSRAKEAKE